MMPSYEKVEQSIGFHLKICSKTIFCIFFIIKINRLNTVCCGFLCEGVKNICMFPLSFKWLI